MKCLRILPEICASTLRWLGRSTRNIVPGSTWVTVPSVTIGPSFDIAANYTVRHPFLRLAQLIQGDRRQIFPKLLTFPPRAVLPKLAHSRESVTIKHCADVARRPLWEWVMRKQPAHVV